MSSSSPEKKTTTMTTTTTTKTEIHPPSLPDEMLLTIFARVPRSYYPTLSLVSKSFRSLLALPVLYRNRSAIHRTESCLYLCLTLPPDPNPRWFTLCRKPNKTLIDEIGRKRRKKSSETGNILIPISIHQSPPKCVVAIGSCIYAIGKEAPQKTAPSTIYHDIGQDGDIGEDVEIDEEEDEDIGEEEEAGSSSVSILDCRFHRWDEGPSMRLKRNGLSGNVVDGKIYVVGGTKEYSSVNEWMEIFDTKMRAWEVISSTVAQRGITNVCTSGVIDGGIYMFGHYEGVIYKPEQGKYEAIQAYPESYEVNWSSWCVIGNILYGYSYRHGIQWYNFKLGEWNTLKGYVRFPGLPKTHGARVRLVDCGGKMAVLWDENSPPSLNRLLWEVDSVSIMSKVLWCGVIRLKKFNCDEIWGEVEWFDPVLTVPTSYRIEHALSATV